MCKIKSEVNTNLTKGADWVNEYNSFVKKANERRQELYKKLSECDKQSDDILHYIEMMKCDAIVSSKLMKKLKELRQERRIIKDELHALDSICALSKKSKYKNNETYEFKTNVVIDLLENIIEDGE